MIFTNVITMYMNFNPNLKIDEIIVRYALLLVVGIVAGVLHAYWMIPVVMGIFLTAVLGWCPVKAMMKGKKVTSS